MARDQPSTLLIGDKATEHAIKQAGTGFDIWHLATHAVLDPDVPERSAVILSESGQDDGAPPLLRDYFTWTTTSL